MKQAYGMFCEAAGVFEHLRDEVLPDLSQPLGSDLSADGLNFARALVVAQAQQCFFLKASLGNKGSNAILAKLAQGASDAYSLACGLVDKSAGLAVTVDKAWTSQLQCWTQYFIAEAHYRLSIDCQAQTEIGQEIARLNFALAASAEAQKHVRYAPPALQELLDQTSQLIGIAHRQAMSDNQTIYLMAVPTDLAAPAGKLMVKPKPFKETAPPADIEGDLMFQSLIPLAVHQSASVYSERVDTLVQDQLQLLTDQVDTTKTLLTEMNLPASLDSLEAGDAGLPQRLTEKINSVVKQGGLEKMVEMKAELLRYQQQNDAILQECRKKIKTEEVDDASMRMHFGQRWQRTPSRELTKQMCEELQKYDEKLSKAAASDTIIERKFLESQSALTELSQGVGPLTQNLPGKTSSEVSAAALAAAAELRGLLGQLEGLLTVKETIHGMMKDTKAREDNAVLTALLGNSGSTESVFDEHLKKYDSIKGDIAENVRQQVRPHSSFRKCAAPSPGRLELTQVRLFQNRRRC